MDGLTRLWPASQSSHNNNKGHPQHQQQHPVLITPSDDDDDDLPPRPPPKDPGYSPYSPYGASRSQTSLVPPKSGGSLWQNVSSKLYNVAGSISAASSQVSLNLTVPQSPPPPLPSTTQAGPSSSKSKFRLPRLRRRPSTSPTVASTTTDGDDQSSAAHSVTSATGDDGISSPWNFRHNVHVDEALAGLPAEWAQALQGAGYSPEQIHALYAKQKQHGQLTLQQLPSASSSASSSSTSNGVIINPRPRKDSIKHQHFPPPTKAIPPIIIPPDSPNTIITNRPTSEQDATIAVATPVRRSPSTLRRIPVPAATSIPVNISSTPISPPPTYTSSTIPVSEKSLPPQPPHAAPQPGPGSPSKQPLGLASMRSTGSIRQALSNTLSNARSNTSLRKVPTNSSDSSSSRPGPGASSSMSPPRLRLGLKKDESAFWDSDDEGADQVSPLTPLGNKSSSRSLRMTPTLPPRLELSLPGIGDSDTLSVHSSSGRKNSSESTVLSIASSSLTPKPTSSAGGSFITLDTGADLGLGDWGQELLKAVTPNIGTDRPGTAESSTSHSQVLLTKHSSQSSTVPSPNSFSTTFSAAASASSQSSHIPPPTLEGGARPFSLYPVTPLNLPLHKKPVPSKPQPVLPPPPVPEASPPAIASNGQYSPEVPPTAGTFGRAPSHNLTRLMVHQQHATPGNGLEDSPIIKETPISAKAKSASPLHSAKSISPTPSRSPKPKSSRQLSVFISEEFLSDCDDEDEDAGVLPYMRSPGPLQASFPKPPEHVGGVSLSKLGLGGGMRSMSGSSLGAETTNTSLSSPSLDYSSLLATPSPTATRFSTLTVRPNNHLDSSAAINANSRPVSAVPYDAVLDDWLEGETDETQYQNKSGPGTPARAEMNRETVYEPGNIIDDALKSSPLAPPPLPPPPMNGKYQEADEEEEGMPEVLAPMANKITLGNARGLKDFAQIAEGESGGVFSASIRGKSKSKAGQVAVKVISLENNEKKFAALAREVALLEDVRHENVLTYAGMYLVGKELWVEMELMERSLADVLAFVQDGLVVEEEVMARFASDMLEGLDYLQGRNIAHRDVRSDNLLLSRTGVLQLSDFSSATLTSATSPKRNSTQGQPPYWMAPEMRKGLAYDPHEADVWSVGATIWEVAEGGEPPFINEEWGDELPELSRAEELSTDLHHFLQMCERGQGRRPRAVELLRTSFVRRAAPHEDVVKLLEDVRRLENGN